MTTSRLRRPAVVAAVISAALAIAGCSSSEAGAAAVVGDQRISVAAVQSGYDSMLKIVGPDFGLTQPLVLDYLILEPYLTKEASRLGRGVSPQDAELAAKDNPTQAKPSPAALKVITALVANTQIRSGRSQEDITASYQTVSDELKAAGVHVNPRYGSGIEFDVTSDTPLSIVPGTEDWIKSKPQVTPAATAPSNTGSSEPTPAP